MIIPVAISVDHALVTLVIPEADSAEHALVGWVFSCSQQKTHFIKLLKENIFYL
jgi:hypothetical protein